MLAFLLGGMIVQLKQRISDCGRDHPVPKITPRALARMEEAERQERISAAKAEQDREESAVRALDNGASHANGKEQATGLVCEDVPNLANRNVSGSIDQSVEQTTPDCQGPVKKSKMEDVQHCVDGVR